MDYTQASKLLGNRDSCKVGNNTWIHRMGGNGDIAVRLHSTYVVTMHADGTYTLRTGGWKTTTTKDRINAYSPARVYQRAGIWYLGNTQPPARGRPMNAEFFEGVRIDSNGRPIACEVAA